MRMVKWGLVLGLVIAASASGATGVYEFVAEQSTVGQSGGVVPWQGTYGLTGDFQLTVDFDTGTARFDWVDGELSGGPLVWTTDLDELFTMTLMAGHVVDNTTVEFGSPMSSVRITITAELGGDTVHLSGVREEMMPNGCTYTLEATAKRGSWGYYYADDFRMNKAEKDSYRHSIFWPENAYGPEEPSLYISMVMRGLVFVAYEGEPAFLYYRFPLSDPTGGRGVGGTLEFDAIWPTYYGGPPTGDLSYTLSGDGEIWTAPIRAIDGHNTVTVGSAQGTIYVGFIGTGVILDNLRVRLGSQVGKIRVPQDYSTIQAAINAASEGDIVEVSPAIYRGPGNQDIDFMGKAITVTSTDGAEQTVIDLAPITVPPQDVKVNHRGFYFHHGETAESVLKGFTIRGGRIYGSDVPADGESWPAGPKNPLGGGIYCEMSSPTIVGCVVVDCGAEVGGGIACMGGSATITDCRISQCKGGGLGDGRSGGYGAGIGLVRRAAANIVNCIIQNNEAYYNSLGGGLFVRASSARVIGCDISYNGAEGNVDGGGVYVSGPLSVLLQNTIVAANRANAGGGVYAERGPIIALNGDAAGEGDDVQSGLMIVNCTVANNQLVGAMQPLPAGGIYAAQVNILVRNSIVWFNDGPEMQLIDPLCNSPVTYSDIEDKYPGPGNISADPLFPAVALLDYHVQSLAGRYWHGQWVIDKRHSPCIDAGNPDDLFDREPSPNGGRVNMGAYGNTAQASKGRGNVIYHADVVQGNDVNDGLSRETAVQHIQTAIDRAMSGDTVFVWPGVYVEAVDYIGKGVVVQSAADAAIIEAPQWDGIKMDAVTFHTGEGPESVLRNFVIRNSGVAVSLNYESSPILTQLTIAGNDFGIAAYEDSQPDVSNCIFHANKNGDVFGCTAQYSLFTSMLMGPYVPVFADYEGGDYHLLSRRGRYRASTDEWVLDKVDSVALDKGDPTVKPSREPIPNGGRLNIGAYGGTAFASMSEWPLKADLNRDGRTSLADLAMLAEEWLESLAWINQQPWVRIGKPYDQAKIPFAAETIVITAEAGDPDGEVVKVEFFANNVLIGEDTDASDGWSLAWWSHAMGTYSLTATATDDAGVTVRSRPIHITVTDAALSQ